ncbi:MAG TPA: hypothetical protein DCS07_12430 [Bdellovibrionales bacterium]|nr:MAG: hypothetical protein A2Z97_13500 [Bdellovibrionales bacterium GWB1_52_6]OFZ06084.1 MAG: hypothetical protein A2X97_01985 [Bdellovibrionales bacterium GWA1_52_35]OFZ34172.1 MAG: hypothetical protein A2070_01785 [Bdellovibrionales bacterium GWC1_52_8]HAR43416.1 hypothetical protein [Bdellovibrionales bacterium]HCM39289.1 hypothetical protein [Bdellovibrionales bacterium]
MENSSRLTQLLATIGDKLSEQLWFQQLKGKWDELDGQSRFYLKILGGGSSVLILLIFIFTAVYGVYAIKSEYKVKSDLLLSLQAANDELRLLRESTASAGTPSASAGPWQPYFETTAQSMGLDKGALTISPEKPGASTDTIKEVLIDISLKHVNIRQIARYAFNLETGARPIKLRNLTIDTKSDPAGYMDATLAVSGFSLLTK